MGFYLNLVDIVWNSGCGVVILKKWGCGVLFL